MAIQGYDTIGPYTHGLWLIAKSDGSQAGVVDYSHLPAQSQGVKFYWLGTDRTTQMANLFDALGKWRIPFDPNMRFDTAVDTAKTKGTVAVSEPKGLAAWLSGLEYAAGHAFVTGPLTGLGAAAEGAGAEAAGGAGAAGAAATAASAAKAALSGLTVGALFSNSSLWAGVGMAILGAVLVMFGIVKLSGADPKQLAKRVVP